MTELSTRAELAYAREWQSIDTSILEEAQAVTDGARRDSYGHPAVNHARTAGLWDAYLAARPPGPLTAEDVCWLNVLQKIARELHSQTRDSLVDVAGYAANIDQIRNT